MGLDLVFNKIIDGERIERIETFRINFLHDLYPELVEIISECSSTYNNSTSDVYICPSNNFMKIHRKFEEFYNKNYTDKNTLKLEIIDALNNNMDISELRDLFDRYFIAKDGIFESHLERIQNIMIYLKEYADKNAYLYLSY